MNGRVALLGVAVATLLTFSGCFGNGDGPADQDPELVAQEAIKEFGMSAGTTDGGDIKSITGSFHMTGQGEGDEGFGMSFDDATIDMLFEWGKSDVMHMRFGLGSGGMSFNIEAWCTPERGILKWGSDIYEGRPTAAPASDEDEPCGETGEMDQAGAGLDMFDSEEFEGLELRSVDTADDGTITAVFFDPEENGTVTATIDGKGRVTRIAFDSPEGTGSFDITYGTRDAITLPEPNKRLPADVEWKTDIGGGEQKMTITSSPNRPPLEEMTARLVLRDWANDTTTEVVSFPTHVAGRQVQAGYTFEYADMDDDGTVSENDTFTFSHPSWEDSWWIDEDPDLFDEWAGASVNESFTPAPGLTALLALGLVALAFVARRR